MLFLDVFLKILFSTLGNFDQYEPWRLIVTTILQKNFRWGLVRYYRPISLKFLTLFVSPKHGKDIPKYLWNLRSKKEISTKFCLISYTKVLQNLRDIQYNICTKNSYWKKNSKYYTNAVYFLTPCWRFNVW